jgi:hypothetical protein
LTRLSASAPRLAPAFWYVLAFAALIAWRLPHLRGPLTDPHAWRQCDTLHTSLDFFRRGFDLMHPAVCWLGAHRTLLLNFPLSEALSALLYRAFGPDPMWDRLVSLLFCVVATLYAGAIGRRLAGDRVGRLTALACLALPLSQYFSRVPHIEYSVIALVNGTFYHALRAHEDEGWAHVGFGVLCGVGAGLVKGPYLATLGLPLLALLLHAPSPARTVRALLPFVAAAAAFLVWREHVDKVNATVPDWTFLPDFYREVNPIWRYTGTMQERLELHAWVRIAKRLVYELATPAGVLLALATPWWRQPTAATSERRPPDPRTIALLWYANCLLHVLVFFRLNSWHNYYQMPFIAPTALLVALGADWLWQRLPRWGSVAAGGVVFAIFLLVALWMPRRVGYDRIDWLRTEAGPVLEAHVPKGELVVASDFNTLPPTDPRLLFRADREGWPMRANEITAERLARLRPYGVGWVAVLSDPEHPACVPPAFLEPARVATLPVLHEGKPIGTLHLFELRRLWAADSSGASR